MASGLLTKGANMTGNATLAGTLRRLALALILWTPALALFGSEVTITRTNWTERWITNLIEVRMPVNRFVNEYRTNWVTQLQTNLVNVYLTNRVTRTLTNAVVVDAVVTNFMVVYQTNRIAWTETNRVAINLLQTNFVDHYQTNWSVLSLTNWETVVLLQTNRVARSVTNVVQVEMPSRPAIDSASPTEPAAPNEAPAETPSPAATDWAGPLAIEATRTTRPAANNLVEVQLKVRRTGSTSAPPQVQHWRVEREDAAILLFGQEQEFKRQLPPGKYKVEAKLKAEGDNPPLSARGTLSVTASDAVIQQRLLVRK